LRLPEDVLRAAGIADRATARLTGRTLVLEPPDGVSDPVTQAPSAAPTLRSRASVTGSQSPGALVRTRALTKRYGSATPIDGLDAEFAPARLTVVTGPSGSGKTTLLHLLAGLELPDAGDVTLDGIALSSLDRAGRSELRRTRLAFVGQTLGLIPFLGARQNAELGLELRGLTGDVEAALAAVGLAEHADRPVAQLSAGQRERAALARAIAVRPQVIVADEPTARLDGANALALGLLLGEIARATGATVICATHDPLLIDQADAELSLASG
ncbi:MAG: ABC transporter ATP-binding protein, partial [Gaiellaceae bacterium]